MAEIGAKIYYEALSGIVIQVIPPRSGAVIGQTKEQDFQNYESLRGRIPTTVGEIYLQFPYGKYAEDFASGDPVRVDIWTKKIHFQKRVIDPSVPEPKPELSLGDRIEETEVALTANAVASAVNAMTTYGLSADAKATDISLADLQIRYAATALKLVETEDIVEILKETMTALIAEIAELKSQSGSGESNGG